MKRTKLKIFLIVWIVFSIFFFNISKLNATFYNWYENTSNLLFKSESEEEEEEQLILPYYIKTVSPADTPDSLSYIFDFEYEEEELDLEKMSFGLVDSAKEESLITFGNHAEIEEPGEEEGTEKPCTESHVFVEHVPERTYKLAEFCFPLSMEEGKYIIRFYYEDDFLFEHGFTYEEEECNPDPIWIESKGFLQQDLGGTFHFQTRLIFQEIAESFNLKLKDEEGMEVLTILLGEDFGEEHTCVPTEDALCEYIHIYMGKIAFYAEKGLSGYAITIPMFYEQMTKPYTLEFYEADTLVLEETLQPQEVEEPEDPEIPSFTLGLEPFTDIDQENKLIQIPSGATKSFLLENLVTDNSEEILLFNQDEEELEEDALIGTGMTLQIGENLTYLFIIPGDLDGDGDFTVVDVSKLKLHMLGLLLLEEPYLYAADVNRSGEGISESDINIVDLSFLKLCILELIDSNTITKSEENLLPQVDTNGLLTENYTSNKVNITIPKGFGIAKLDTNGNVTGMLPAEEWDGYLTGNINNGIVVVDSHEDGNEFVWVPVPNPEKMYIMNEDNKVGRLYATSASSPFDPDLTTYTYTQDSGFREPDVLTNTSTGDITATSRALIQDILASENTGTVLDDEWSSYLQNSYQEMIESVITHKGFYIGRYETSLNEEIAQSKSGETPMNQLNWYDIYLYQQNMYTASDSIKSCMIWGSAWDQVMLWMRNVKNVNDSSKYYILDSSRNGMA